MSRRDREVLIEQVVSAWRPEDLEGGPRSHPAWHALTTRLIPEKGSNSEKDVGKVD